MAVVESPADTSAATRIDPWLVRIENVTSPLVDFRGRLSAVPSVTANRASTGSPIVTPSTATGVGSAAAPPATTPLNDRTSSCPYGSASDPVTVIVVPTDGRANASGRRTMIPAVASWIAMSGGVPSRPAAAVTTPRTVTRLSIGSDRAPPIVVAGSGVGDGLAEAP